MALVIVRVLALLVVVTTTMMAVSNLSNAAVYMVGDSAGWTTIGGVDYKQWSSSKNFQVGDLITFQYNSQFHNVIRVTHPMYQSCNASVPLDSYATGNDTIKITTKGHHFFICGVPGHCQTGQKVDINVIRNHPKSSAAPTPSALASPAVPTIHAPAPGPSTAAQLKYLKGHFCLVVLAITTLALLVSGLA